ncbi:MAG: hypothetical protein HOP09_03995 [Hyphomicrobium sp.]|nr:hypothetical protein [Hyphomicrobium sp.]
MRFAAATGLLIAAIFAVSTPSAAAVFGSDNRSRLAARDRALSSQIGTLSSSQTGAFCTAFCAGDDLIATASHCLYGTAASAGPDLKDLTFKLGSARTTEHGTPLSGSSSLNQTANVASGTTRLAVEPPIGAVADWAVARLKTPACRAGHLRLSQLDPTAIRAEAARGNVYQIAVHADLPDTDLRRGAPCAIGSSFPKADAETIARDFTAPQSILFHTCDTGGGSSGSPLLIDTPNGPEVVGINVGTYILSRNVSTARDPKQAPISEAIANTAIWIAAIAGAVAEMGRH